MANIARLKDAEISNGNVIDADDLDSEFNQIISAYNTNDTTLTSVTTGTYTFSGVKTFSSTPKMNAIDERTAASGVTIDSVVCKDGAISIPGSAGYAPAANGDLGYDSTSHTYDVMVNSVARRLLTDADLVLPKGYINGKAPTYASAATVTFPSGLKARDSTNAGDIELAADVTVTLAGTWSVGTPGLDAGSEASGTWYYYYLIKRVDTGVTSVIASTVNESVTGSITLPANYTLKRQLPLVVRNDGSSNIVPFVVGSGWPYRPNIHYSVDTVTSGGTVGTTNVLAAGTSATFAAVDASAYVPPGARYCTLAAFNASSAHFELRQTGSGLTNGNAHTFGTGDGCFLNIPTTLNTSQSFDYKTNTGTLKLDVLSYQLGGIA